MKGNSIEKERGEFIKYDYECFMGFDFNRFSLRVTTLPDEIYIDFGLMNISGECFSVHLFAMLKFEGNFYTTYCRTSLMMVKI